MSSHYISYMYAYIYIIYHYTLRYIFPYFKSISDLLKAIHAVWGLILNIKLQKMANISSLLQTRGKMRQGRANPPNGNATLLTEKPLKGTSLVAETSKVGI